MDFLKENHSSDAVTLIGKDVNSVIDFCESLAALLFKHC